MKTKISLLLTLFLLLVSCQQEMPVEAGANAGKGHISFNLASMASGNTNPLDNKDFSTKTSLGNEDAVKRMDVVVFNASTGAYLSTFTQSTVDVSDFTPTFPANTKGVTCNIYFIANLKEAPSVSTFSEANFKLSSCGLTTLTQAEVVSYGIPMCGSLLGCAIPADGIITNAPVTLTRLLARVDIVYSNAVPAQFTATSIQLCNVPSITPYYSPATIDAIYYSGMTVADLPVDDITTLPVDGTATTFTYYVPANRRGIDVTVPTNIDSRLKNGFGIINPTNVKVGGKQAINGGLPMFYTFYLGGNSTTDYNLLANTKYTVNATIKGISGADKRVTEAPNKPLELASNCYMVAPGSTIYIPVSRAVEGNTVLKNTPTLNAGVGTGFIVSSDFTAGLLWSDVSSTHVSAEAVLPFRCVKVVVPVGAPAGNSVVYIKDANGKIVWSWHIWVTDYAPSVTSIGTIPTATGGSIDELNSKYWLDRNLGATSTGATSTTGAASTAGDVSSYGLYYQWGRKDPFPGANGVGINAPKSFSVVPTITYPTGVTILSGSSTVVPFIGVAGSLVTLATQSSYSIEYPLIFLTSWAGSTATIAVADSETGGKYSWNTSENMKSIFDPCPSGWRVPLNGSWVGLDKKIVSIEANKWDEFSLFEWSDATKFFGRKTNTGAFYPAPGARNRSSGAFFDVGKTGYYWSGSVTATYGYCMYFFSGNVASSNYDYRASGFSVRCVQGS